MHYPTDALDVMIAEMRRVAARENAAFRQVCTDTIQRHDRTYRVLANITADPTMRPVSVIAYELNEEPENVRRSLYTLMDKGEAIGKRGEWKKRHMTLYGPAV